jgi:hypothetical protein
MVLVWAASSRSRGRQQQQLDLRHSTPCHFCHFFFFTPACAPPLIGHPCTLPPPLHPHFALGRLQWYVTDRLTGRPTDGQSTRNPLIVRRQCCTHREGHECPSCFLQRLSCNEASRQHTCTAPSSRTWAKPTRLPWPKTARVVFQ